ncbi:hypothetical protein DUNSADRAFT_6294 [Dunaliella salina]|uniref:Encoded protein n=1 Tax=Dunaliella salina TaxID=3046 RepID=A0ABQ7GNJ6_DUNSA|nr:hypothetical protein DUNSADRAFT_6294 [Dunaliella salina]|eukprot:KAF5836185.1 hypothetical protein DUNSADRAFT_6294 [Dunaliella salina]
MKATCHNTRIPGHEVQISDVQKCKQYEHHVLCGPPRFAKKNLQSSFCFHSLPFIYHTYIVITRTQQSRRSCMGLGARAWRPMPQVVGIHPRSTHLGAVHTQQGLAHTLAWQRSTLYAHPSTPLVRRTNLF